MECNLVWNHTSDFKIERARSVISIWNHKYDFRPKLHSTQSITTLLNPFWNRQNTGLGQFKYFIDAELRRFLNKKRNRKRFYFNTQ